MDIKPILDRLDTRIAELHTSAAAVSREATGSPDTIRNWHRAVKEGRDAGITLTKLGQLSEVLGIEVVEMIQGATTPIAVRGEAAVKDLLRRISGLPEDAIGPLWRVIRGYLEDAGQLGPDLPRDQSEPANPRREEVPSR